MAAGRSAPGVADPNAPNAVWLRVYDISNGMAATWSQLVLGRKINGVWHTGINVYGLEYFYGGGVDCMLPSQVESAFNMEIVEIQLLGYTKKTRREFERFLVLLKDKFTPESYDLIEWNCNHFSDTCSRFLLHNRGIPEDILDLPETIRSTFMGDLLLRLFQRFHQRRNPISDPPRFALESPKQGLPREPSSEDRSKLPSKHQWNRRQSIDDNSDGQSTDSDSAEFPPSRDSPEMRLARRMGRNSTPPNVRWVQLLRQNDALQTRRASSYTASSFRQMGGRVPTSLRASAPFGRGSDQSRGPESRRLSLLPSPPARLSCPQPRPAKRSSAASIHAPALFDPSRLQGFQGRELSQRREAHRTPIQTPQPLEPNRQSLAMAFPMQGAHPSKQAVPTSPILGRSQTLRAEPPLLVIDIPQALRHQPHMSRSMDRLSGRESREEPLLRPVSLLRAASPSVSDSRAYKLRNSELPRDSAPRRSAGKCELVPAIHVTTPANATHPILAKGPNMSCRKPSTSQPHPKQQRPAAFSGATDGCSFGPIQPEQARSIPSPFGRRLCPQFPYRQNPDPPRDDNPCTQPGPSSRQLSPLPSGCTAPPSQSVSADEHCRNQRRREPEKAPRRSKPNQFSHYRRPFFEGLVKGFSRDAAPSRRSSNLDCPDCSLVNAGQELMCARCGFDFMAWSVAAV